MKKIKLTQGKYAIVDDEDFDYFSQWKWYFSHGYAVRQVQKEYKISTIWMHRLINNTPYDLFTDHINRNRLDNRKCNLRTVTRSRNQQNHPKRKDNTSGYRGVYWEKFTNKWRVVINSNNKSIKLGRFENLEDAIKVRRIAEGIYHAI